jgi:hypothetical protein
VNFEILICPFGEISPIKKNTGTCGCHTAHGKIYMAKQKNKRSQIGKIAEQTNRIQYF